MKPRDLLRLLRAAINGPRSFRLERDRQRRARMAPSYSFEPLHQRPAIRPEVMAQARALRLLRGSMRHDDLSPVQPWSETRRADRPVGFDR